MREMTGHEQILTAALVEICNTTDEDYEQADDPDGRRVFHGLADRLMREWLYTCGVEGDATEKWYAKLRWIGGE